MRTQKEPVRLRQRKMPTGNISLYLDIYSKGRRTYEYLRLYLVPERTKADKAKNKETLQFAETVKAKRVVELRNNEYGFNQSYAKNTLFFDYFRSLIDQRKNKGGDVYIWNSCLRHLKQYEYNPEITFADITPTWVMGFKSYLENDALSMVCHTDEYLSQNTKWQYFSKLRTCIGAALESGIITTNPMNGIKGIKKEESTRMYLTLDEVKMLVHTECKKPRVKDAFLFSCLTGLRKSDIERITWGDVYQQGEYTRIVFRQKKTKGQEYLDINDDAVALMRERREDSENVFELSYNHQYINRIVRDWVKKAGINKEITFHCARHTFATMMLDIGTDLYTVSKLLGHSNISTTQIYTKVLDKNKQKAVSNIPTIL